MNYLRAIQSLARRQLQLIKNAATYSTKRSRMNQINFTQHQPLIVIIGATGTGKTKLAVDIAKHLHLYAQIISTDSMQIYEGLDIATNKATDAELEGVHQCMVGFVKPEDTSFTVVKFRDLAIGHIRNNFNADRLPILIGGTSYYMEAILWNMLVNEVDDSLDVDEPIPSSSMTDWYGKDLPENYLNMSNNELHDELRRIDLATAEQVHPNNRRRVMSALQVYYRCGKLKSEIVDQQKQSNGICFGGELRFSNTIILWTRVNDVKVLNTRLDSRVDAMVTGGLRQEIEQFYDENYETYKTNYDRVTSERGIDKVHLDTEMSKGVFQCIGLKEFAEYLSLPRDQRRLVQGDRLFESGCELLKLHTRQYARRQDRWITNRFLRQTERQIPPIFALDTTNTDLWIENVQKPAIDIVDGFMNSFGHVFDENKKFEKYRQRQITVENAEKNVTRIIYCDCCDIHLQSAAQYDLHVAGQKHKHNVKERRKIAESS